MSNTEQFLKQALDHIGDEILIVKDKMLVEKDLKIISQHFDRLDRLTRAYKHLKFACKIYK